MAKGVPLTAEQKAKMAAGARAERDRRAARFIERRDRPKTAEPASVAASVEPDLAFDKPDEGLPFDHNLADFERQAIAEGILTLEDILAVRIEAKAKVILEQRSAAKKKLVDQVVERERRTAGLIPAETERQKWLDEIVTYTVRLPKQGPRDLPEHRVDGRVFTNGRSYDISRAQYLSLIDTEQRAWHHQAQFLGQSKTYYDELLGSMVYQGGVARGSGGMA